MDNGSPNNPPALDQSPDAAPRQPDDQQIETAQPPGKFKLTWQFAAGFLGWYFVMALFYGLLFRDTGTSTSNEGLIICSGLIFPLQVILLIFSIKDRYDFGWGMLSAIGVNFVISLVLGLFTNALCFVPFFNPID